MCVESSEREGLHHYVQQPTLFSQPVYSVSETVFVLCSSIRFKVLYNNTIKQ